ncbi:tyrosine-type recombinase/integrase [Actinacidiphila paucisporea]|uniref:Site-specific recombinase XerD n=1 Tax=Actinacidiphila paucisporea TaxID=310782 RepID=A0A1M7QZI1_9ACTN|nr:site-specific integrase [Actinacidiphila paucisporea]SHN37542.1 Site-specific recombinase XerD [Actinacidiphila paucisporea]
MNQALLYRPRRTARSDPRLGHTGMFDAEINARLAEELPAATRHSYFNRATIPRHWLEAILENQPSYRAREKGVALDLRGLPASMVTEFAWSIERQVQLGMRIQAQYTTKLTRQVALVLAEPHSSGLISLTDLSREEWSRRIRKARTRMGEPIAANQMTAMGRVLGRTLDLLVHVYHQGPWWELNVWNPQLDTRIPLREHEPKRRNLIYFSHLTTPWLREAAKWWLSRQLERGVYTWSTAFTRQVNLSWFQRYLDAAGCDGPHLVDDQRQLGRWVQGFRQWLNQQRCTGGVNKGALLGQIQRRAAMTGLEQLYRFLFEERQEAAEALSEPRWLRLGPQHTVLFRYGDKPTGPKAPPPDAVLSDAVISRIAEHSGLLAQPKDEGGFDDEQLVRIVGLLIKTGRRISEITLLDFDPIVAIAFPDPDGHVARLRYQQTKIITDENTILIDQETLDLVREQQKYARAFMADQNRAGVAPKYLFLGERNNRIGDHSYPATTARPRLTAFAAAIDLRDDQGHLIKISKTHTFRHTKATSLLNAGVPLHVAMRYMGHKTPAMFMHYARTLSATAEREFLRYQKVTADGRTYDRDPQEMFEALALDQRTDRILPNGYCTLPPRQSCDKGNACLSCTKFVTDATFTDVLQQQRKQTAELIDQRQEAHTQRFGQSMTDDNIWLRGRSEEVAALDGVLLAIERIRHSDGTTTAVRGAGAPQRRLRHGTDDDNPEAS